MADIPPVNEEARINRFAAPLPLHPDRAFPLHGSDAELVPLGDGRYLASTVDVITEEIAAGFYPTPETMGWILVQANLSDLAAVGADPVGLLLAISLGPEWDDDATRRLSEGIAQAARSQDVYILGGDLNYALSTSLGACAIGTVDPPVVGRIGIRPGDGLYATGPLGLGNAMAAAQLSGHPEVLPDDAYRPMARLVWGRRLRPIAQAMMDTSDALVATLDQLANANAVHIELDYRPEKLVHAGARAAVAALGLPEWSPLFAEHGEYELVVAIAANAPIPSGLVPVGRASEGTGVTFRHQGRSIPIDCARVRNMRDTVGGDPMAYIQAMIAYGAEAGLPLAPGKRA
jgi:thiamine-monophosphate kinase